MSVTLTKSNKIFSDMTNVNSHDASNCGASSKPWHVQQTVACQETNNIYNMWSHDFHWKSNINFFPSLKCHGILNFAIAQRQQTISMFITK